VGTQPDDLLPCQQAAVTHRGGRLLVLGAAGTGKTRVVARRLAWLVREGVRAERIAVLAPTPGKADALHALLEDQLSEPYDELVVVTPVELAARVIDTAVPGLEPLDSVLGIGERFALLLEHLDQLSLQRHDFGGSARALLAGFVRRIDALKANLVGAEDFARWAYGLDHRAQEPTDPALEQEFAEVYRTHERLLAEAGLRDAGDLIADALAWLREDPRRARLFDHFLVDDGHELTPAARRLALAAGGERLTVTADPGRGGFSGLECPSVTLTRSLRCPERILRAASELLEVRCRPRAPGGEVAFWRCAGDRAQAQAVAADIERLIHAGEAAPERIAVLVPAIVREGQAVAVALEQRAVPYRLLGEAAFFQRAEIRDLLAWLRLLADPADAPAVVRALARPPINLRSVDIARCTQIARRRKLDMVAGLAAALDSPQVPPETRERIHVFLKLFRSAVAALDSTRPDLYVHRLIDRLGLRRHLLFAAQTDVVERLRALAAFTELAEGYARRSPQATARQFARQVAAVAESGLIDQADDARASRFGEPGAPVGERRKRSDPDGWREVRVLALEGAAGVEADHVYIVGLHAGVALPTVPRVPPELGVAAEGGATTPPADGTQVDPTRTLAQLLGVGITRAHTRVVLAYPKVNDRGAVLPPLPAVERVRMALGREWEERGEELFGPAETLHSTYRLLRDELLESTLRIGGRLGELRFDTDLDISHAVVRYLELLKLAALISRPQEQSLAEALRDVNARILQAVTAEQREILTTSALDDYLLDAERGERRRAQAIAARDEPSLEPFLPRRGEGVVLSASDIDTYRTCPLKYKFARVFRIPHEPTVHQRFGIVVHQVLERFHARSGAAGSLAELLGLLDAGWRRAGFGDSEEERQLRAKATAALERYYGRFRADAGEPLWFERAFTFKLGPHLLRGRVDRVDRLPGGEYELIDYKTGRPKTQAQLAEDLQLSLYAVGAREAWRLESSQQAYYYLLDDEKVSLPADSGERAEWVREVVAEVADGILGQGFEPTPSYAACSVCEYQLMCPPAER
jgi:DNA helicase-2/ATP-dependent DNA helicase PcrA